MKKGLLMILILMLSIVVVACSEDNKAVNNGAAGGNESVSTDSTPTANPINVPEVQFGYATCINCYPLEKLGEFTENATIKTVYFKAATEAVTALATKNVDIIQVTYLHYLMGLDKGLDMVAVSGQINGGSDLLLNANSNIGVDDWDALKEAIKNANDAKKPFKIGSQRGSAQDIHLRGELLNKGIDPEKDVEIINVTFADQSIILEKGEVDMIASVEPFAAKISLSGLGKHFAFPYDQAAGNLTNIIVTRSDYIKDHPEAVEAVVESIIHQNEKLTMDKAYWLDIVNKYTPLEDDVGYEALKNAFPDVGVHKEQMLAMVEMMEQLGLLENDISAQAANNVDYSFLEKVTGKSKDQLGDRP